MVYAPQRRHAVASLGMTTHSLSLLQHLQTPNTLILLARILAQVQITSAYITHPHRSLTTIWAMLSIMNGMSVLLHCLDYWGAGWAATGLILDFVGETRPPTLTRILLLDLLIYLIQTTSLVVSFLNSHGSSIPSSLHFPYPDPLLPPEYSYTHSESESDSDILFDEPDMIREDGDRKAKAKSRRGSRSTSARTGTHLDVQIDLDMDSDVELGQGRRTLSRKVTGRRRGFRSAYEELDEEEGLWLNDDDTPAGTSSSQRLLSSIQPTPIRIRDPPLIFSLSLPHILNLIFRLPAPSPPPRAFAGGTPLPTPPVTPGVETGSPELGLHTRTDVLSPDQNHDNGEDSSSSSSRLARMLAVAAEEGEAGAASGEPGEGRRIPGEYRRNGGDGDGG